MQRLCLQLVGWRGAHPKRTNYEIRSHRTFRGRSYRFNTYRIRAGVIDKGSWSEDAVKGFGEG
jgi:hypothetical protein